MYGKHLKKVLKGIEFNFRIPAHTLYKLCRMTHKTYNCVSLYLCFSIAVPSLGGFLGSRGVGEGAEAEEPAVTKGGKEVIKEMIFICFFIISW